MARFCSTGDMFILSPQVEELAEYCLQRRTTATLAPPSPADRTEDEKKAAFTRSAVHAWLEARSGSVEPNPKNEEDTDELMDDDSSPNQGSTVASTSEIAHGPSTAPRNEQLSHPDAYSALFPARPQHTSDPLALFQNLRPPPQAPTLSSSPPPLLSSHLHRGPSSSTAYFAESSSAGPFLGKPLPSLPAPPPQNELPPFPLLSELTRDYFSGIGHHSLPIVERQAFRDWVKGQEELATRHSPSSTDSRSSNLIGHELVFAMLAIAARYTPRGIGGERGSSASVDLYKVQAGQALATAIRAPTLHTVQAAVLLAHVDLGRDDLTSASAHFGELDLPFCEPNQS